MDVPASPTVRQNVVVGHEMSLRSLNEKPAVGTATARTSSALPAGTDGGVGGGPTGRVSDVAGIGTIESALTVLPEALTATIWKWYVVERCKPVSCQLDMTGRLPGPMFLCAEVRPYEVVVP
jgi:hypothetical protein